MNSKKSKTTKILILLLILIIPLSSVKPCWAQQASMTYELIDNLNWGKGMVSATSVTETYQYDEVNDKVIVSLRFDRSGFAPLPPMLALAKKYRFPIEFNKPVQDTGQSSDLGPLMGVEGTDSYTYEVSGLGRYVLTQRLFGNGTVPQSLQEELEAEVDKILAAGHLAPTLFLINVPGSGCGERGHVYWLNPGETLYYLAEIAPLLSPEKQQALKNYLHAERSSYPPEEIKALWYNEGTKRRVFDHSSELLGKWWGDGWAGWIYFRTHGEPKIWNLYGLARYYELMDERPTQAVIDKAKAIVLNEMSYSDWASLYWQNGHWPEYNAVHAVNQLFAGLVGYIRLARLAQDENAEALGWGLLARMAALRFAMGKYTQFEYDTGRFTFPEDNPSWWADHHNQVWPQSWKGELITFDWTRPIDNVRQIHWLDDQHVETWEWFGSGAAVGSGGHTSGQEKSVAGTETNLGWQSIQAPYLLPFADMVPELGRFLKDHLKQEVKVFSERIVENQPHWYIAYSEGILGYENGYMPPSDSYGHFMARAWVLEESPEELEKYIDYPWLKVGDFFYLHKLAETIKSYRGVTWDDATETTPTPTVTATPTNTPTPTGTLMPPPLRVYLPIILKAWPSTPTPTSTLTATLTITPTPTPSPSPTPTSALTISNLTTNLADYPHGQVPRYEKFELTFEVNTVAENLQLPYDPSPPPGVEPGIGITVNALFTPDNWQTVYVQPAFYYQEFEDKVKSGKEWFYPTGNFYWKVRFAPNKTGTWQYKLTAQDASGTTETQPRSFTVVLSDNKGFIRVSQNDPRYFEFDDGTYFPALGYNMNYDHVSWENPILDNQENFQKMGQNGIQLIRIWLSQWGIFTSAWGDWVSPDPNLHAIYLAYTGLSSSYPYEGSETSMLVDHNYNPCMFLGFAKPPPAVKRNTNYRIRIRYKTYQISGPRVEGKPYGLVAKVGGWLWGEDWQGRDQHCHNPGTGTVVTAYESENTVGTPNVWRILEGSWYSGSNDFLLYFYIVMENVNQGFGIIDHVWIEEDLGNGQYGPNIISKAWMSYHLYFAQRNSYAFDKLLDLAHQYNIYLRPVILEKNEWTMNRSKYDGSFDDANPSNNNFYGNWREVTKVRWLQRAWWRYLQARWGYSTNIHSWELLNEGDPWNGLHYSLTDEFGKYMRCRVFGVEVGGWGAKCNYDHPNDHPVSTSNWHSFPKDNFWANEADYPNVDFADIHEYPGVPEDMAATTHNRSMSYGALQAGGAGKPVVGGELGFGDWQNPFAQDTNGVWLHNLIWGGINPGGLIESYWYEDSHIYSRNRDGTYNFDHRNHYGNYYNFIRDIPLNNGKYEDAQAIVSNPHLRAWGQKDLVNGNAHLWIQNKNHTWKNIVEGILIPEVSGVVIVAGFALSKHYTLEWWDTYTGSVSKTETVTTDGEGKLRFQISNLQDDLAVKVLNLD